MEPQIFARRNRDRRDRYNADAPLKRPSIGHGRMVRQPVPLAGIRWSDARFVPFTIRTPMKRLASACLLLLALSAAPAIASQQGVIAMKNWKSMDLCAKEAQAAFPDFTPEANAKRDEKLKECLEGKNLPPRAAPQP
jgi:hypothetical protein